MTFREFLKTVNPTTKITVYSGVIDGSFIGTEEAQDWGDIWDLDTEVASFERYEDGSAHVTLYNFVNPKKTNYRQSFFDDDLKFFNERDIYTDEEGQEFFFVRVYNSQLLEFEDVEYAEDDEFCERPLRSGHFSRFTVNECINSQWIKY